MIIKTHSLLILRGRAGQMVTQAREQDIETEAVWMEQAGEDASQMELHPSMNAGSA